MLQKNIFLFNEMTAFIVMNTIFTFGNDDKNSISHNNTKKPNLCDFFAFVII